MKFAEKTILCNIEDAHKIVDETRNTWIKALLLRLKLDPGRVNAATSDDSSYGLQAWREYLVYDNHISISKKGDLVLIEKHYEDDRKPKVLLGKWEKPELVRVKEGGKWHMEVRLNYWQLV